VGARTVLTPPPPDVRDIAESQLTRLPAYAEELAELLAEREESYRRVNQIAPQRLRAACAANLDAAFTAFMEGGEPPLAAIERTFREQAELGISLPSALRALRISGTFVFEAAMARIGKVRVVAPDTMLAVSARLWEVIDVFSQVLTDVYRDLDEQAAAGGDQVRHATLEAVLSGRLGDPAELEDAAQVLGIPARGTYVVLVADRMAGAGVVLGGTGWPCVWLRDTDTEIGLVLIPPATHPHTPPPYHPAPGTPKQDLAGLRELFAGAPVAVGVSQPVNGLGAVPAALRRARIARRGLAPGATGLFVFGERPVSTLVAGSMDLARELAAGVLQGVLTLPVHEREVLLETLAAWFEGAGSAREAGARLQVHPNTVRYRIRRVQELTARDLTDPRSVAELYAALEAVRLDPARA
jgi:hypothetical protein